jgi:hypothetical protein
MKSQNSKIQAPSSRETSISKRQLIHALALEFDNWCSFGTWNLELGTFKA